MAITHAQIDLRKSHKPHNPEAGLQDFAEIRLLAGQVRLYYPVCSED